MAIPTRLSRKLHESLGDEGANDLEDWMVQVEDRRSELHSIVEASKVATDARFAEFGARMDLRFSEMDRRLDARFADTDRRMDAGFAKLETLIERRSGEMIKWSFAFWCGAAAIAVLARAFG